jgi:hypothetical protein
MNSAKHRSGWIFSTILVLSGLAGALPAQAAYTIKTIDYPGALNTQFWGINNAGQIVGLADFDGGTTPSVFFVYDPRTRTFTPIPNVPGMRTAAIGINKAGTVVGSAEALDSSFSSGLMINGGAFSFFSHPGFSYTQGRSINDSGLVAGFAADSTGSSSIGFLYNPLTTSFTVFLPSEVTIAHGINKHGQVSGSARFEAGDAYPGSPDGRFGFMRRTDGSIDLFRVNGSGNETSARGLTGTGRIAGFFEDSDTGRTLGFVGSLSRLANYVLTVPAADVLDVDGSVATFVEGMSESGKVVGFWTDSSGYSHGFIGTPVAPKKK